jgi:hypothetical protein
MTLDTTLEALAGPEIEQVAARVVTPAADGAPRSAHVLAFRQADRPHRHRCLALTGGQNTHRL